MFFKKNILRMTLLIFFLSMSSIVFSETKYNIKEMTPEVKMALEGRRSRFDQLKQLKAQGLVGENKSGYTELLADDETAKALVEQENMDRKIIYTTIAEQNNLIEAISTIEQVFAQVQRDKAESGEKIQLEDGSWVSK